MLKPGAKERGAQELARLQLVAYNASDLDGFVSYYHPDVQVYDEGVLVCEGRTAFKERYRKLFETMEFGGTVDTRIGHEAHCVDIEHYWRKEPGSDELFQGVAMVHYTIRDDLISQVRFFR